MKTNSESKQTAYQFSLKDGAADNNSVFGEEKRIVDEIDPTAYNVASSERWSTNYAILIAKVGIAIVDKNYACVAVVSDKVGVA